MSCHICAGALLRGDHFQQSIAAKLFLASARLSSRNERVTKDNSLGEIAKRGQLIPSNK